MCMYVCIMHIIHNHNQSSAIFNDGPVGRAVAHLKTPPGKSPKHFPVCVVRVDAPLDDGRIIRPREERHRSRSLRDTIASQGPPTICRKRKRGGVRRGSHPVLARVRFFRVPLCQQGCKRGIARGERG